MQRIHLQPAGQCEPVAMSLERADAEHADAFVARIGKATIPVEVKRLAPGAGWLKMRGRIHRFYAVAREGVVDVWLDGATYRIAVIDRKRRRGGGAASEAPVDRIIAPMPGTVLTVSVAPGDAFEAHQPLVILESMKMEMTLSAPHAGTVGQVRCKVGELVSLGEVLVTLNAVEPKDAS